ARGRIAAAPFLDQELGELRRLPLVVPPAVLPVAALRLALSLALVVGPGRGVGRAPQALGLHLGEGAVDYHVLAAALAGLGGMTGLVVGQMMGEWMASLYLASGAWPALPFEMGPGAALAGAGTGGLAAVAGSPSAVRRVLALATAQALAPAPP